MRRTMRGLTLVELITVMVIVAILTSIAIPGYRSYVIRANRTDAKTALLSTSGALERCFTRFNRYDDPGCDVGLPRAMENYRIEVVGAIAADTFTIQAVPLNGQTKDAGCGTLGLNAANVRTVSGSKTVQDCWGK